MAPHICLIEKGRQNGETGKQNWRWNNIDLCLSMSRRRKHGKTEKRIEEICFLLYNKLGIVYLVIEF